MEEGESMEDSDARHVKKGDQGGDVEGELIHDYRGRRYLINSDYVEQQRDQRTNSEGHDIELTVAKELINSNLEQLTDKQKQIVIGRMQGKTFRQIAKEMHVVHMTVYRQFQLAQKKLAGLINQTKNMIVEE